MSFLRQESCTFYDIVDSFHNPDLRVIMAVGHEAIIGILIGIVLNLWIALGSMVILTILILTI